MSDINTRSVSMIGDVASGESKEFTVDVRQDSEVRDIRLHNYQGERFNLQYKVLVRPEGDERSVSLIEHAGEVDYVAGDDDKGKYSASRDVRSGDEIVVRISNTGTSTFDFRCEFDLATGLDKYVN